MSSMTYHGWLYRNKTDWTSHRCRLLTPQIRNSRLSTQNDMGNCGDEKLHIDSLHGQKELY